VAARPPERTLIDDAPAEIATVMVSELEYVRNVTSFTVATVEGDELLHVDREDAGTLVTPPVRQQLAALRQARAGQPVSVRITNNAAVTVLSPVLDVPGYGWQAWSEAASVDPVTVSSATLGNGILQV
jgi:hypothetical protein